jgi:hypothetical protein
VGAEFDAQNLAGVAPDSASRSGGKPAEMKGADIAGNEHVRSPFEDQRRHLVKEDGLALNMGWWTASAHNNRAEFLHRVE